MADRVFKTPVSIDVSAYLDGPRGRVRGWICGTFKPSTDRLVFVCCSAGGACSTSYFDLQVPGLASYSMAEHFAGTGLVTIALDYLGIGTSTRVLDLYSLTPELITQLNHAAFSQCIEAASTGRLANWIVPNDGEPLVVGLGHSMGAMLAIVQQARHGTYDAVVNLGHGGDDWSLAHLDPEDLELMANREELRTKAGRHAKRRADAVSPTDAARQRPTFHAPDVPTRVLQAMKDQRTELLHACGYVSMMPYATAPEKAALTAPLFLGFGQYDNTRRFHEAVSQYPYCNDVTLKVVEGSGHNHNQSSKRQQLWSAICSWIHLL